MTAQPTWSPVDSHTADLLSVLADPNPTLSTDISQLFLAACRRDAMAHGGEVSVNRVRPLMSEAQIPARRYSALWAAFTGRGKPMRKVTAADEAEGFSPWEVCKGSGSGNDGRPLPRRRWVGESSQVCCPTCGGDFALFEPFCPSCGRGGGE